MDDANALIASFWPEGIARMREGQTLATTRAEIEGLLSRLTDLAPGPNTEFLRRIGLQARIASLKESLVGDLQGTLWILFATVGIVLLIACANVANLLLVRAEARQRELALRVALGAGRLQVLRTFMGESLTLALAGGVLGVVVAGVAVRLTTSLVPTALPRMAEIGVDAPVLGFTAAVALACAVVVSEAFAEKWWPNTSPLGRRMRLGAPDEDVDWYTIVGVVENVRQYQLEEVEQEMVYFPLVVDGDGPVRAARTVDVVIRTTGDPLAAVSILRDQVRALNPRIPIANPRAMTDVVESAAARTSFTATMLGAASGIALLLGLVGIYGVISYDVSQRTREIGVRMALGASGSTVRRMVVQQGLALSGAGVALGLVAAALLSRVLGSLLYGVSAIDPLTYVAFAFALIGVAVLASLVPAMRAASVDASRALRAE